MGIWTELLEILSKGNSKHLSAEENVTLPTGVYVVCGEYEQVKAIKK